MVTSHCPKYNVMMRPLRPLILYIYDSANKCGGNSTKHKLLSGNEVKRGGNLVRVHSQMDRQESGAKMGPTKSADILKKAGHRLRESGCGIT